MFLLTLGCVIHSVLLLSIFDIYFKSPIVKNVTPYEPIHSPIADRLVMIVMDGLRADSFLNYTAMPYLRTVASNKGMWGISHTRVPTKSRPCHIAMLAGFFEDPSSINKAWKQNPVDFDSVFNRTVYSWCWGASDILHIFVKEFVNDHIFIQPFDAVNLFSANTDATLTDTKMFNGIKEFLAQGKIDGELNRKLHTNKIMFFINLGGSDTAGHVQKPNTKNFLKTIAYSDSVIKELECLIKNFYNNDGRTTFVVTADHGMADWGSHGVGSSQETQTPFVIWGAGVKDIPSKPRGNLTLELPQDRRLDIEQNDITPLLATILAIPVPVNSIGLLPSDFLNMSLADRAKAVYGNSRQLATQYNTKRVTFEAHVIQSIYKPYKKFDKTKYNQTIEHAEKLLAQEKYEELILLSKEIMTLSISGLDYYHNYYQKLLLAVATLIFIGWIVLLINYLIMSIITEPSKIEADDTIKIGNSNCLIAWYHSAFVIITLVPVTLVYIQNLPWNYYIYFTLPVLLWWLSLRNYGAWITVIATTNKHDLLLIGIQTLCYTLGSLAVGLSFTYRWMLSIPLVGMAVWPYASSSKRYIPVHLLKMWPVCCILLSIFTFLPVVGRKVRVSLVILAGILKICAMMYSRETIVKTHAIHENKSELILVLTQIFVLLMALLNIFVQSRRFALGTPVNYWWQAEAWAITGIAILLPIFHSRLVLCRLSAINISVLTIYLLLSVAHEGLFLITLIITLSVWIMMEYAIFHGGVAQLYKASFNSDNNIGEDGLEYKKRGVDQQDFRRAFFFLVYLIISFFGTGNLASLNSFEVRWVTCFVTSYRPVIILGLILLKSSAPLVCVACSFRAIQKFTKAPEGLLNIIVLIYSNIIGIQLLFNVKNTGTWLEIATSISLYVIVEIITLFIVISDKIADTLTKFSFKRE